MTFRRHAGEQGQILVLAAAVMTFLFVPLCVFLIDTGLLEASYAQLGETLQASVEDGASQIDQQAFRQSDGETAVLDQSVARQVCERSLETSGLPGLEVVSIRTTPTSVTATAIVHVRLLVLGSAKVTQTRSASFVLGT
jgi:hypothetical protein